MIYEEKNHDGWLENIIEKKVIFLGEDQYDLYFNVFIPNTVYHISYDRDGDIIIHKNYEWELGTGPI
ncbi:hypothetical protein [Clostridium sp.]|uniref:hypothetical protein n=1 Tax=Clostridium sp. TaxID=1506 RepID=UPI002FCA680A